VARGTTNTDRISMSLGQTAVTDNPFLATPARSLRR
jgi:hypothetical protein